MIANLLNTLVGLWLAHMAIFPNALSAMSGDRLVLIAAVATIMLALWARRSDVSTWQSNTAVVAGVLLAILAVTHQVTHVSDVLMFWGVLWAGLVSATVSLWAALYRPPQAARASD
jgi:hypothetical protein